MAMLLSATTAHGLDDIERMQLANSLGSLLAAESLCGLAYDQSAIQAFIDQKVPADDLRFAPELQMMTNGAKYQQQDMSASMKTALCRQMQRAAKSYGFIK